MVGGVAGSLLRVERKGICTRPPTNSAKVGPSALAPHEASAMAALPKLPRCLGVADCEQTDFTIAEPISRALHSFRSSITAGSYHILPSWCRTRHAHLESTISTGGAGVAVAAKRSIQRKALAAMSFRYVPGPVSLKLQRLVEC